jgi:response regulator RpfG family c-di-GMP phosphodiesterase
MKIWLIDDDNITNMLNRYFLEEHYPALEIQSFIYASKALEELQNSANSPDFILLDINMPEMDGWEFMEQFKLLNEDVKSRCRVFILTSSLNPIDIQKSKTYNEVRGFASKPLTTEILNFIRSEKTNQFIILT